MSNDIETIDLKVAVLSFKCFLYIYNFLYAIYFLAKDMEKRESAPIVQVYCTKNLKQFTLNTSKNISC